MNSEKTRKAIFQMLKDVKYMSTQANVSSSSYNFEIIY